MRTRCERCGADLDAADYIMCARCRRRQRPLGILLATIAAASLVSAAAQLALLVGCCGDNVPPAPDATPVDATPDACICRPEWPGCPPGCSAPVDAGEDGAP